MQHNRDLANRIDWALDLLIKHCHSHAADIADLREAGVSPSRVAILFPFDFEDFRPAVEKIAHSKDSSQLAFIFTEFDLNALWRSTPDCVREQNQKAFLHHSDLAQRWIEQSLHAIACLHALSRWLDFKHMQSLNLPIHEAMAAGHDLRVVKLNQEPVLHFIESLTFSLTKVTPHWLVSTQA